MVMGGEREGGKGGMGGSTASKIVCSLGAQRETGVESVFLWRWWCAGCCYCW